MLSSLRNATQSIFAKILLLLLVVSFAVWGASSAFVSGSGNATVTFGDTNVGLTDYRLAYNLQLRALSRQLGDQQITREQARAFGVEQSVLNQMIAGAVLDENARRMGMGISDDQLANMIADDPSFKDSTGRFSRLMLEGALRQIGMRQDDYVRNRKALAVRLQYLDATTVGAEPPEAFFEAFGEYQAQKRVFEYLNVGADAVTTQPVPTDSDIQTFYDAHKRDYVAPEYRAVTIVRLTADDIARPDSIDEKDVAAEYEANKAQYTTGERRQVQQLSFKTEAEAQAALKRIRDGETFDAIATEMGRTPADLDLGLLTKKQIPDLNIANAAFALQLNGVSDPITTIFNNPVLLRVVEIQPEQVKPLSEVSDEIRKQLALTKAANDLYDVHDRLEDARAAGDNLEQAAKTVGVSSRAIDNVDANGKAPDGSEVADLPEKAKLLAEIFQTDPGVETDPLPIGATGFVWYEVKDVTPERQKPLEEVRDEVAKAWTVDEIAKKVSEIADTIRDRAEKGESLADLAKELLPAGADGVPATPKTSPEITRSDTNDELPRAAVTAAFSIPKDSVTVAPAAEAPARVVIKVVNVIDGKADTPPESVREQLDKSIADDLIGALVADFQSRGEVRINEQAINQALSF